MCPIDRPLAASIVGFEDPEEVRAQQKKVTEEKLTKLLEEKDKLEKKLREALRLLKNENAKGSLLMNIDRKVPHGRVVRLMSVVRESGFQHIVFGTQSAKPK